MRKKISNLQREKSIKMNKTIPKNKFIVSKVITFIGCIFFFLKEVLFFIVKCEKVTIKKERK